MANAQVRTITTVVLELSPEEAAWLRALVQNPIGCEVNGFQPDEDSQNREIREAIFSALPSHYPFIR
jgi:hypothetical protein